MNRIILLTIACLAFAYSFASADVDFGVQVDWNKFQNTRGSDAGVGARLEAGSAVRFIGAFDYYFVDTAILGEDSTPNNDFKLKFYEISADLAYYFPTGPVRPYIGGGVSISKRTFHNVELSNFFDDNKTELGGNVLGGLKFNDGGVVEPFVEARGVFYGGNEKFNNRFVLTGGIVF